MNRVSAINPGPARNRTNAAWLSSQLEGLRFHLVLAPTALTIEQISNAVAAVINGRPWRSQP
jgi:hypothetical protein